MSLTQKASSAIWRTVQQASRAGDHLWIEAPAGAGALLLAQHYLNHRPALQSWEAAAMGHIHGQAGVGLPAWTSLVPWRAPHFSVSAQVLCGTDERPGELQLASYGVLVLYDALEFSRDVLVQLAERLAVMDQWPRIVATTQPCPCGQLGCSCADDRAAFAERIETFKGLLPVDWVTVSLSTALSAGFVGSVDDLREW